MKTGILPAGADRLASAALGIALILFAWQAGAGAAGSALILPSPGSVAEAVLRLPSVPQFRASVAESFLRVLAAFGLATSAGALTGMATGMSKRLRWMLSPLLTVIRATPVLALILLAMFWFPSGWVPIFSAFLMAYPVVHTSMESGMGATDPALLQMAGLFGVPRGTIVRSLRIPSAKRHLAAGIRNALGLCWKVVIAGEILSQPRFAMGTGMQSSRLSLETAEVFAWAAYTVLFCGLSEYLLGLALRATDRAVPGEGA